MEVKSNIGGYGNFRPLTPPRSTPTAGAGEERAENPETPRAAPRMTPQSDRIASLASYASKQDSKKRDPAQQRKYWEMANKSFWGVAITSFVLFAIVFTQPIVAPVLSLGCCFSGGLNGWLEFSFTALSMSLYPGLVAAVSAVLGLASDYALKAIDQKLVPAEDADLQAAFEAFNK